MTSEELAQEVMSAVVAVQSRILGVGKEQYDRGSEQKFERMSFRELIQFAREEVEDGIAYNVMLRYRLNLLEKSLEAAYTGYDPEGGRHAKQVPVEPPVYNFEQPPRVPPLQGGEANPTPWTDLGYTSYAELSAASRRLR